MILHTRALGLCLAAVSFAGAASAATIVTIDVPDAISVHVAGIDKKGDAVGTAFFTSGGPKGYVRRKNGTFTFEPGAQIGAVSANGTTAGVVEEGSLSHGFVGDLSGANTLFDVKGLQFVFADSVNNSGDVVGFGEASSDAPFRGFLRHGRNGKAKAFDAPGAGTADGQGTEAFSIVQSGFMCGIVIDGSGVRHGWLRDPSGHFTTIDPPGSIRTTAIALQNDGTVGGTWRDANSVSHAWLRAPDGTFTTFDSPEAGTQSGQGTTLVGINKNGVVVGTSIDSSGVGHGYLRNANGRFSFFDAPGAGTTPGVGTFAYEVNDNNQVTGDAVDDQANDHAYIRMP